MFMSFKLLKMYCYLFISELIEENEEKEEFSQFEEKHHVRSGEKTKQKDLKKRRVKKSFPCTQCGKTFTRSESLKDHMNTHTGERPYACDQCGNKLWASNLKKHLTVHT